LCNRSQPSGKLLVEFLFGFVIEKPEGKIDYGYKQNGKYNDCRRSSVERFHSSIIDRLSA